MGYVLMVFQIIFSLVAIGLIYFLNKGLACYDPALFTSPQQASDIFLKDLANTKSSQMKGVLYFSPNIVLFNMDGTSKNKIGLSFTMGDAYVNRLMDQDMLLAGAKNILVQGHQYFIPLKPHDLTLPELALYFSSNDALFVWLKDHHITLPKIQVQGTLGMKGAL